VLLAELDAAQDQRGITQEPRIDVYLDLSSAILERLIEIYPEKSRTEVEAALFSDLNLICGIEFSETAKEHHQPLTLYGASLICHASLALQSKDHLVVRSLSKVSPSLTEKKRERALVPNVRFRPGKPGHPLLRGLGGREPMRSDQLRVGLQPYTAPCQLAGKRCMPCRTTVLRSEVAQGSYAADSPGPLPDCE
jgi:hypothetical protein